ncbi:3-mercaptopyruvate sulfurtransferase [Methylococcus sp. EFPC2]|uniref:3-mercaptopyruvate sulfurtransferase n=1 Tax=Methylococcus sp. EFPC2 TaxID=2812648 RepID=UPI0019675F99|nr:3-mercaptopyruvate sulfurtransferase [Methylococcus sp. EFPC2]QSA98920.1 3-mercaptopyruvate sulfurtransferase [Methylococcus sp. EFPC2]
MTTQENNALVDCEWLAAKLGDADLRIIDASFFLPNQQRHARAEYQQAHIPGALFFDIDEVADRSSGLPHMLPSPEHFAAALGRLGIDAQTRVVVYDSNFFMASARLWWTFRVFGHERVSVLDGGLERWRASGYPVTRDESSPAEIHYPIPSVRRDLVCDLAAMRRLSGEGSAQIVDARSPGRFAGTEPEPRPGLRSGHIPGSRNLFFKDLIDDHTRCLRPLEALATLFAPVVADERRIVATCGTGVTAAILALGLYRLGYQDIAVYDGSWTEWGGLDDTPVATG